MNSFVSTTLSVKETAAERILRAGIDAVSTLELLTTFTGNAQVSHDLLRHFGSLSRIAQAEIPELIKLSGIGKWTALRIVAAFELVRRKEREYEPHTTFNSSEVVAEYMIPKYRDASREVFSVLFLNRCHELIAEEALFTGGVSSVIVDPKVIFKKAMNYLASSIILVHNHPSGNLTPSPADIALTEKIKAGADLLEFKVIDHVIVSCRGYYSFADEGRM